MGAVTTRNGMPSDDRIVLRIDFNPCVATLCCDKNMSCRTVILAVSGLAVEGNGGDFPIGLRIDDSLGFSMFVRNIQSFGMGFEDHAVWIDSSGNAPCDTQGRFIDDDDFIGSCG